MLASAVPLKGNIVNFLLLSHIRVVEFELILGPIQHVELMQPVAVPHLILGCDFTKLLFEKLIRLVLFEHGVAFDIRGELWTSRGIGRCRFI